MSQYHQWMPFSRPFFWVQLYWLIELCVWGDLYKHAEVSPVLVINSKIIFWRSLLYWLDELCLQEGLNSECVEASQVSLTWSSVSWETWMSMQRLPYVSDECPVQDHLQINKHIDSMSSVSQGTWAMHMQRSPCVTNE